MHAKIGGMHKIDGAHTVSWDAQTGLEHKFILFSRDLFENF
jgi:hypothetical protein